MRHVLFLPLFFLPLLLACSSPSTESRVDADLGPSGADFQPVSNVLVRRCGSLDCHGSKYRNMRLYGYGGARLDPAATPDRPGNTTAEEAELNRQAAVSVEPEVFRDVIAERGRAPERLTLYRKALRLEYHKGGRAIAPGSAADDCLRSWLVGAVDVARCAEAITVEPPPPLAIE